MEGAAARTVVQPRRPLKDFMWQSPMCSMRSGSTHPQFEAGLLLRLMAPPRIKVAAVLYQGSLNCGLSRSQSSKIVGLKCLPFIKKNISGGIAASLFSAVGPISLGCWLE